MILDPVMEDHGPNQAKSETHFEGTYLFLLGNHFWKSGGYLLMDCLETEM